MPSLVCAQTAPAPGSASVELETIDVQGRTAARDTPPGTVGYVASRSAAATKTQTPVIEVPQSLSTITRQQLDDRDVQTVIQAVGYTPGVTASAFGYDPRFDSFYVRGFDVTYTGLYRDGLRQEGGSFSIPRIEPYGVQDISILRGPASGLYGLGSPGGIVDVTTKRPTQNAFGELQLQLGSYDRFQGNFDIGGPVPGNDQFSYRLTGLFRQANTWQPGAEDNRNYIAPAITWRPDRDTTITFLGEYQTSRTTGNSSYYNTDNHQVLASLYSNDPAFGAMDQQQYRVGYAAEHRFNDFLTVRQNFRYYHVDTDARYTEIDSIDTDANTAQRSTGRIVDNLDTISLDNQAEMHFGLGDIRNTLLVGLNYQHSLLDNKIGFGTAPDLDLGTLNYGRQYIPNVTDFTTNTRQRQDEIGLYAQEQARLDNFLLTLNGQQSWVSTKTTDFLALSNTSQDTAAFTGRVGLSYLFDSGITPYVSYASAFSPQIGMDASGAAFKATTGVQKEAGVKYQIPNMNVLLGAAVFDITQTNVLRTDPNDIAFQSATGEVESKGVELEATASLATGLNVTASYAHLDVRIVQGASDTTGNKFSGIPENSSAIFAKYTFQPGWHLAGLGIGAGVRYVGASYGDDQNTFRNKDTAFVDAVMDYDLVQLNQRFKGLKLQVNATNLFDTRHVSCQTGYCYLDERRQVIGSLVYRW